MATLSLETPLKISASKALHKHVYKTVYEYTCINAHELDDGPCNLQIGLHNLRISIQYTPPGTCDAGCYGSGAYQNIRSNDHTPLVSTVNYTGPSPSTVVPVWGRVDLDCISG